MISIVLPAWAITATAVAAWALWRVYRLRNRIRYLTAVLHSGDTGIAISNAQRTPAPTKTETA